MKLPQKIILIRHADSLNRAEFARENSDDLARPLSKLGKAQSKKIARFVAKMHAKNAISKMLFSPAKRTKQTIKPLRKLLREIPCEKCEAILPDCTIEGYKRAISGANGECVLLVGHQMDLGDFAAFASGSAHFKVEKGAIIELSLKNGAQDLEKGYELTLLIAPSAL